MGVAALVAWILIQIYSHSSVMLSDAELMLHKKARDRKKCWIARIISKYRVNIFFMSSRKRLQVWAIKCGQRKTETANYYFDHANQNVIPLVSLFLTLKTIICGQLSVCISHSPQNMLSRAIKPALKTTPNWVHLFSKSNNSVRWHSYIILCEPEWCTWAWKQRRSPVKLLATKYAIATCAYDVI